MSPATRAHRRNNRDRALATAQWTLTAAAAILLVKLALDGYWLLALLAAIVILRPVYREVRRRRTAGAERL